MVSVLGVSFETALKGIRPRGNILFYPHTSCCIFHLSATLRSPWEEAGVKGSRTQHAGRRL